MSQDFELYHITCYKNLNGILTDGMLICKNNIDSKRTDYISIAYETLQDRRKNRVVPLPPYGNLHDYVPFYFAPRSPMLYAIRRGCVEGYQEGQENIIYFVVKTSKVLELNLEFVFTDGHPIIFYSKFYKKLDDMKCLDWEIMKERYWRNTDDDGDRKRRRQAEFLIYQTVPIDLIERIVVMNQGIARLINALLVKYQEKIPVEVRRDWYYD